MMINLVRRLYRRLGLLIYKRKLGGLGAKTHMPPDTTIICPENIYLGERVAFGNLIYLAASHGGRIVIGDGAAIAARVAITTTTHDPLAFPIEVAGINRDVVIGDYVWIGIGAIILPGVTIGRNSVIGAGSVVTKDIPPNSVAIGAPARVLYEKTARLNE